MNRPNIVCICGSGRFWPEILKAAANLTLKGNVVVMPNVNTKDGRHVLTPDEKARLDALHRAKIDMADDVLIVNQNGYIGDSTAAEIKHALCIGKRVTFTEPGLGDQWIVENVTAFGGVMALRQATALFGREREEFLKDLSTLFDMCETAWGVIANAPGGLWHADEHRAWREAAEKWRDGWHKVLGSPLMAKTERLRVEKQLQARIDAVVGVLRVSSAADVEAVREALRPVRDIVRRAWEAEQRPGA